MVNAAVMGVCGPLRYILLTDRMLEALPPRHIEAVLAHEIAHARLNHLPWLAAAALGLFIGPGLAVDGLLGLLEARVQARAEDLNAAPWLPWIGAGLVLAAWIPAFGWIARRFERHADAFAAVELARRHPPSAPTRRGTIPFEATRTMIRALGSVARLNGAPADQWSWRHGSIRCRQCHLARLTGRSTDDLPIDRTVRRIRRATVILMLAGATALTLAWLQGGRTGGPL